MFAIFNHYEYRRHFVAVLLIILVSFILCAPILISSHCLKWDAADYFLPMRWVIADAFHHHELPMWNPYTRYGFPLHADPQSGACYLPVLILAYWFGYNFKVLALEFLIHICIAGLGFYCLSYAMHKRQSIAIILAVCYLSCGFFVSNAQHISWIIAAAWLPWVMLFYIKSAYSPSLRSMLGLALFGSLMLSGGYPAFTIILLYSILIHFVFLVVSNWMQGRGNITYRVVISLLFSSALVLGMSALMWHSFMEAFPLLDRHQYLDKTFTEGSFTLKCFISFLFPGAVVSSAERLGTDVSMANAYFGLFPLLLLPLIIYTKSGPAKTLFIAAVLFFAIAVGDELPLRRWLFMHLPLMNTFRFPAMFRLFGIVSLLLSSGYVLSNLLAGKIKASFYYFTFLFICSFIFIIELFIHSKFQFPPRQSRQWPGYFQNVAWRDVMNWQLLIQSFFMMAISFVLISVKRNRLFLLPLCLIILQVLNSLLFASFNSAVTMDDIASASKNDSTITQLSLENNLNYSLRGLTHIGNGSFAPQYYNVNVYSHKISADGYNPFFLESTDSLWRDSEKINSVRSKNVVFCTDTASHPKIISASENQFQIDCYASSPTELVLQQNYYKHWHATVDEKESKINKFDIALISVPLSAGTHNVKFYYQPSYYKNLYYLMIVLYVLVFIGWIIAALWVVVPRKTATG